jgi:pimeloyl-ACP methyl ester carboxylesterase
MNRRSFLASLAAGSTSLLATALAHASSDETLPYEPQTSATTAQGSYATINGLEMYYEIHGSGQPTVLLHGALSGIQTSFGNLIPSLAKDRQVIAVEMQSHGRTQDIDRPLRPETLADDIAALIRHLRIAKADVFGYSMGGAVALQVAVRHPMLVRKLALASVSYRSDGQYPEVMPLIGTIQPEMLYGTPFHDEYLAIAPNPERFGSLVAKVKDLSAQNYAWSANDLRAIKSPVLTIVGDADNVSPEHAAEMYRLFGGVGAGDLKPPTKAQLAVIPGATHIGVILKPELLSLILASFLDSPLPA